MESGDLLVWRLEDRSVVSKERRSLPLHIQTYHILLYHTLPFHHRPNVAQLKMNKKQDRMLVVSATGVGGSFTGLVAVRAFPGGEPLVDLEWPYRKLVDVVWTADEQLIVCYG